MSMLVGIVLGILVATLARIVRAELLLPKALADLTEAVRTLHTTAHHLQSAIAQLREEWVAQQAQPSSDHKHRTTKGANNGS